MKNLLPLLAVLGWPRITGGVEREQNRRSRVFKKSRTSVSKVRLKVKITDTDKFGAGRRWVVNAQNALYTVVYKTPICRIALAEDEESLYHFREELYATAAILNKEISPVCEVLPELTWTPLGDDAYSTLKTLMGNKIPDKFWSK